MSRTAVIVTLLMLIVIVVGGVAGYHSGRSAAPAANTAETEASPATNPDPAISEPVQQPSKSEPDMNTVAGRTEKYGPDWTVCGSSDDQTLRINACNRLLKDAPLTQLHRAWTINSRGAGYELLGEYVLAAQSYQESIETDDSWPPAYENLADVLMRLGRPGEAVILANKAIELKAEGPRVHCLKSKAYRMQGKLDAASEALDLVPKADAEETCVLRQRGEIASARGQADIAVRYFRQAENDPEAASLAQCRAGDILLRKGRLEEALLAFEDGVRLNPENKCAVSNMAMLIARLRPPDEAVAELNKAIQQHPDLPILQCEKASVIEDRDAAAAFKLYDEVIAKHPALSCALFQRAHLMFRMGEPESAQEAYSAGLKIAPNDYTGWYGRGQVGFYLGETETSISDLNNAMALNPESFDVPMLHGEIYLYTRQYESALRNFIRADKLKSGDRSAAFLRAETKLELGRFEEVIDECQKLIGDNADDSVGRGCLQHRARAFLGLQKPGEAIRELQTLAAKEGAASGANLYLTAIHLLAGDRDSAAEALAAYRSKQPDELYGALWAQLMMKERETAEGVSALTTGKDIWPQPLLHYAMGDIDAAAVMKQAAVPDFNLASMRAAEAEFYIGVVHFLRGDADEAMARFRRLKSEAPIVMRKRLYPALYKHSNRLETTLARWLIEQ